MSDAVKNNNPKYAVSALLCGACHFFNALVLGSSLRRPRRNYKTILMVVGDYDNDQLEGLGLFWDEIKVFEDLKSTISPDREMDVRCNAFYAYSLVEYEKILVLHADMCVAEDINEIFEIRTPATTTCAKEAAWKSDQPLEAEQVITDSGWLTINPAVFLIEPSSEEFEDTIDALQEKHAQGEDFYHPVFLVKYFLGGWYSVSHEYNFRPAFVSYGDNKALGILPGEVSGKLLHFAGALSPSDLYFYGKDFLSAAEHMPDRPQELLSTWKNWRKFPDLQNTQSHRDRFFGMYKLWFSIADQVTDIIRRRWGKPLPERFRPSRKADPKQLEESLRDKKKEEKGRKSFRLGAALERSVQVDERTRTTRLRMVSKKQDKQ